MFVISKQALVLFALASVAVSAAVQGDHQEDGTTNVRTLRNNAAGHLGRRGLSSSGSSKSSKSSKSTKAAERGIEFACDAENSVAPSEMLCGGTITDDMDLETNIMCEGVGETAPDGNKYITVDDATLDCKGFSIMGPISGAEDITAPTNSPAGVLLVNGGSLKNCDISGFYACVRVQTPMTTPLPVSSIDNVYMSGCRLGLFAIDGSVDVKNSATVGNRLGVRLGGAGNAFAKFDGFTACGNTSLDISASPANTDNVDRASKGIVCDEKVGQTVCLPTKFDDESEITACDAACSA